MALEKKASKYLPLSAAAASWAYLGYPFDDTQAESPSQRATDHYLNCMTLTISKPHFLGVSGFGRMQPPN